MNFGPLEAALKGKLSLEEPLSKHTSFKIGGPAQAFAKPGNAEELKACLEFAKKEGLAVFFLAGGTNLLVKDGGIRGLVIRLDGDFKEIKVEGEEVYAGAGANLALVAKKAAVASLTGLEFAVGIPGSFGGGLVMNAGAHGGELKDVVTHIGLLEDGEIKEIPATEAAFVYRGSRFKGGKALLLWARMRLKPGNKEEIEKRMDEALKKRRDTQPIHMPNAGCVFKNPEGQAAGRLIEQAGLKGKKLGGARISEMHANFVVNEGGAKASDVLGLMEEARKAVKEKFGVSLENEVLIVGQDQ